MDILSEILKQVLEGAAQQQQQTPQPRQPQPQQRPQQPPQGMPSPNDLSDILTQIFGGGGAQKLPDVVKQFEETGMRHQVDSWVRPGPNKPVDRRQVEDAFGQRELEEIARSKGIDRDQLAEVLAKYIPRIIDELTPSGQLPSRR
ncbi:MAG: YidB family protein [Planctomycetia bacterium]|nr:YidB family protein [Planctomycetia bacterium]